MALFQKSVLRKHLQDLDKTKLQEAWQFFKNHFHNPDVQKHIRDSKEEEYQEGFVRDLFVNVLGYTLKPQPNYNFVLEKKTEADATKSDGAILRGEAVTGVVELKDTDTTELDSIEKQVFGYKHKHKNCVYVITSNFEKLRFYINDSIEYEEFDLFNLTENDFALLYLCLQQKSIEDDIPLKIKQASAAEEEGVTKKLYSAYSTFRQQLFTNIAALNPQYYKLELFKKTQKLLDRFLFILFAEDRLLVPPNSVREILKQWEQLRDLDNYVPLYERFKKYFGYLNKGHAGKQYDIYAYNGGLFADDEILDNVKIEDKQLYEGTKALSNYDFQSEVDVNILGHIFEHSLSEIEEVQAELEGKAVEKSKTKRKKDGVFYTPRYITKYIVENTVGKLCRQKKEELKITHDEFAYRKRRDARENKLKKLDAYRKWLLGLTICDPACGSGAFLNQALEYLIAEHRYIDELRARMLGEKMVMNDMETEILSHNLFGVDINEEAVEIARLSLWLRTAQKGRKLSDLSKNIKCGNSLIDDPAVAGDKAFNWKKEFPNIFSSPVGGDQEGACGFDVVIGNPPYVRSESLNSIQKKYFKDFYKSAIGQYDIYVLFYELAFRLLKLHGKLSYISPNKFLLGDYGLELRKKLLRETNIEEILDISMLGTFEDASVYPIVFFASNSFNAKNKIKVKSRVSSIDLINSESFLNIDQCVYDDDSSFVINTNISNLAILNKIEINATILKTKFKITRGFRPPPEDLISFIQVGEGYYPLIKGEALSGPFELNWDGLFVNYIQHRIAESKAIPFFTQPKVFIRDIGLKFNAVYDNENYLCLKTIYFIYGRPENELKTLTVLLNSSLMNFYFKEKYSSMHIGGGYLRFRKQFLDELPIKANEKILDLFPSICDTQTKSHKKLINLSNCFLKLLNSKFDDFKLTRKLEDWPSLSFKNFLKELTKQKIKLSLAEQTEWMQYFENEKAKANAIQLVIDTTDKEIDQMVYQLYGLAEEEIEIVEG